MADDPLTAALEDIRERAEKFRTAPPLSNARDWAGFCSAADVPSLLAAIEAVLKEHQRVDRPGWHPICSTCHRGFWPCETVRAITRELTGKEPGNGRPRLHPQRRRDDPGNPPARARRHAHPHGAPSAGRRAFQRGRHLPRAERGSRPQADYAAGPAQPHPPRRHQVRHALDAPDDRPAYLVEPP